MSSHSSKKIDQKEYLKKYLSGDKVKKKKKNKKHKKEFGATKVKIIDDDTACTQTQEDYDEELLLGGEDAPQIVGEYVESTTNGASEQKWRSIGVKEEIDCDEGNKMKRQPETNLWGAKKDVRKIKDEFSPNRQNRNKAKQPATPDNSPPRRKQNQDKPAWSQSEDAKKGKRPLNSLTEGKKTQPTKNYRDISRSPDRSHSHKNIRYTGENDRFRNGHKQRSSQTRKMATTDSASSDQSPPRHKPKKSKRSRPSPQHINRSDSSSDLTPPRTQKSNVHVRSADQSPIRQRAQSPQEKHKRNYSSDLSPPRNRSHQVRGRSPVKENGDAPLISRRRENKHGSSSDLSPPRSKKNRENNIASVKKCVASSSSPKNLSPPRFKKSMQKNRDSSSDQSPPRRLNRSPQRRQKRDSSSDLSPLRSEKIKKHHKQSREKSYSHNGTRSQYQNNNSPVRVKRENCSPDQTPPRRTQNMLKRENSPTSTPPNPSRWSKWERQKSKSPPPTHKPNPNLVKRENSPKTQKRSRWDKLERNVCDSPPPTHKPKVSKTLDGKKAGLQDAKSLMQETEERRKQEEHIFNKMSKEISGRDAEVRVRNTGRKGKRAREAEAEDPEERRRKEEHERKKKEKYDRWGKGLKQVEDYKQRREVESYEGSKPLARYENDEDLDRFLREQERADDPMLEYMRKKKKERQKETGETVMELPKYEGSYPENRFGIRPGYRWDGVDRSNGFEQKWFDVQNEKRAREEEAYMYSVEDM